MCDNIRYIDKKIDRLKQIKRKFKIVFDNTEILKNVIKEGVFSDISRTRINSNR